VQADRQQYSVSSDGRFLMNTVKDDLAAPMTVTERLQISRSSPQSRTGSDPSVAYSNLDPDTSGLDPDPPSTIH